MKFLGNMGVSPVTIEALRQRGYDAVHLYSKREGFAFLRGQSLGRRSERFEV